MLSVKEKAEIEQHVKQAIENGWIEQSSSAYGAQTRRFLTHVHQLQGSQKITVKNKFPMPRIDDLMHNLCGAQYFSTLERCYLLVDS